MYSEPLLLQGTGGALGTGLAVRPSGGCAQQDLYQSLELENSHLTVFKKMNSLHVGQQSCQPVSCSRLLLAYYQLKGLRPQWDDSPTELGSPFLKLLSPSL